MEKANFTNENEAAEEFYVLMDTVVNETTYILASEVDPEEAEDDMEVECFIMKLVGEENDEVLYEMVEDDEELSSISKIFEELLEEEDISISE